MKEFILLLRPNCAISHSFKYMNPIFHNVMRRILEYGIKSTAGSLWFRGARDRMRWKSFESLFGITENKLRF